MRAYYNEIDPFCVEWLRNLIAAGHIAEGDVDERDVRDVGPDDLAGYTQCHFFAGIGVWSYALRLAGLPDDKPVWTGSCPCQSFSAAGRRKGFADERHLWPAWFHLVEQCRPSVLFGEQVASPAALTWLDLVQDDLEGAGYAVGASDLCAAGVGAPHIRQRLYWMAYRNVARPQGRDRAVMRERSDQRAVGPGSSSGGLADPSDERYKRRAGEGREAEWRTEHAGDNSRSSPLAGVWRDADWLRCRDGKWRPARPGTFPLSHGTSARVGQLRAYGNSIVAPQAAEFVKAAMECMP